MNLESDRRTEVARLRLEIIGDAAEQTVQNLEKGLKDINSELRLMERNGDKGSDAWKVLKKAQSDVKDELKEVKKSIDLNERCRRDGFIGVSRNERITSVISGESILLK